jgi:hypothetical protein
VSPVETARHLGGDDVAAEIAAQHKRLQALRAAMSGERRPVAAIRSYSSLDRNARGELLIWPQNRAAVLVWLATGDQWHRAGLEGAPVAHDAAVALAYAQELARLDPSIRVWDVTMAVKFVASCVLRLYQEARR